MKKRLERFPTQNVYLELNKKSGSHACLLLQVSKLHLSLRLSLRHHLSRQYLSILRSVLIIAL